MNTNTAIVLQYAISLQAVVMLWLMGDGNKIGPVVGLLGQVLWVWYAALTEQWGLTSGIAVFTLVHARNCRRMRRADRRENDKKAG